MKRKEIIGNTFVAISILIAASFAGLCFSENAPNHSSIHSAAANLLTVTPFDYYLDVYPVNGTIRQGNGVSTNVNITYVQGSAQNVTLTATGPEGVTFNFSNQKEPPSSDDMFTSNLTINVPIWVPTGVTSINVTSSVINGDRHSCEYSLVVLDSEIQVPGNVVETSNNESWPMQIEFINGDSNYVAYVHLSITTPYKYTVQQGTYSIFLPNHQNYTVICKSQAMGDDMRFFVAGTFDLGTIVVNNSVGENFIDTRLFILKF